MIANILNFKFTVVNLHLVVVLEVLLVVDLNFFVDKGHRKIH